MQIASKNSTALLSSNYSLLFLIILYFFPTGLTSIGGNRSVIFALLFFIVTSLMNLKDLTVSKTNTINVFAIYLALILVTIFSIVINIEKCDFGSILIIGKYTFYLVLFLFGMKIGIQSISPFYKPLKHIAYIILSIQLLVLVLQLFSPSHYIQLIYDQEKQSGIRLTGTFSNPNYFALMVYQAFSLIYILEKNRLANLICFIISLLMIALSGSRTILILFIIGTLLIKTLLNIKKNFNAIYKYVFVNFAILYLIILNIENFPYLNVFYKAIISLDIYKVNTIALRVDHWKENYNQFIGEIDIFSLFFGLGPIQSLSIMDNDFLFIFFRQGFFGFFLIYLFYIQIFFTSYRLADKSLKIFIVQLFILLIIGGLVLETFNSWFTPIIFLFFCGMTIGWGGRKKHSAKFSLEFRH